MAAMPDGHGVPAEGSSSNRPSLELLQQQEQHMEAEGPQFVEMDPSGRFGRFDKVLGRGAFKVVYKAFDNQEGMEVAWNQVRVSELLPSKDGDSKDERDRLLAEIRMLKQLKHKNIMSFYAYWWDPRTYAVNFITELFTSGTLRQYRKRHKMVDEEVQKRWAWQILCGLVYLHGHTPPIIHRDLKCDNIFINGSDGTVKIGDLGLATLLRSRTAPQSVLGTPEFMAPELYEEAYDAKVDVYSFGMCLLELDIMEYPYNECKNAAQIYRKVSLGIRPAGLQKVRSRQLAELINLCIAPYDERPESRQLLKHPYFDTIRAARAEASRSQGALQSAVGGSLDAFDYSSVQSGGVSRTVSSLAGDAGPPPLGRDSFSRESLHGGGSSATGGGAGLGAAGASRTVSSVPTDHHSDTGSIRSQPSNASDQAPTGMPGGAEDGGQPGGAAPAASGAPSVAGSRPGSAPASKPGSPQLSPRGECSPKASSPGEVEGTRCEATDRRFVVLANYAAGSNKLLLRLRICEPGAAPRTVEFEFELGLDTAFSVAGEMVEDLQLSPEDAAAIAQAIKAEVENLSTQLQETASQQLEGGTAALVAGLHENAANSQADCPGPGPGEEPPPAPLGLLPAAALLVARQRGSGISLASNASASSSHSHASAPPVLAAAPTASAAPEAVAPTRVLSPPPFPPLPPGAPTAAAVSAAPATSTVVPPELSPSQRVLRSNSIDAGVLLRGEPFSRSSSAVQARDMAQQSPHHAGSASTSGALTPPGGILSPATSAHDKRIPLNKLFENLQDLAASREDGGTPPPIEGLRGSTPSLPLPLPGSMVTSSSAMVLPVTGAGAGAAGDRDLLAPLARARSETSLPTVLPSGPLAPVPSAWHSSSVSPRSHGSFPSGSNNLAEAVARLDLAAGQGQATQQQQQGQQQLQQVAAPVPGPRLPSRDVSPSREAGAGSSPLRGATAGAEASSGAGAAAAAALNGKKPAAKDKEALRKQAADAMKAVEMRSLNLLEGGLLAGKATRGTPMAASKSGKGEGLLGAAAAVPNVLGSSGSAGSLSHSSSSSNLQHAGLAPAASVPAVARPPAPSAAPGAAPGVAPPAPGVGPPAAQAPLAPVAPVAPQPVVMPPPPAPPAGAVPQPHAAAPPVTVVPVAAPAAHGGP